MLLKNSNVDCWFFNGCGPVKIRSVLQLTWYKSTPEEANSYEDSVRRKTELNQQGKRSALMYHDENEEEDGFVGPQRMSTVVSSYSTSADIPALPPASVFLVEVIIFTEAFKFSSA